MTIEERAAEKRATREVITRFTLDEYELNEYEKGYIDGASDQQNVDLEGIDIVKETYHTAGYEYCMKKVEQFFSENKIDGFVYIHLMEYLRPKDNQSSSNTALIEQV